MNKFFVRGHDGTHWWIKFWHLSNTCSQDHPLKAPRQLGISIDCFQWLNSIAAFTIVGVVIEPQQLKNCGVACSYANRPFQLFHCGWARQLVLLTPKLCSHRRSCTWTVLSGHNCHWTSRSEKYESTVESQYEYYPMDIFAAFDNNRSSLPRNNGNGGWCQKCRHGR